MSREKHTPPPIRQDIAKRSPVLDFGIYFQTDSSAPIDFTCRDAPSLFHDLVFLGSYIHDARVKVKDICLQGKRLQISLQRARWERYKNLGRLESIPSLLTVSPVVSVRWESGMRSGQKRDSPQAEEFTVRHLYLGESYWDNSEMGSVLI
jgi:hypothetical protein